jgi:hypothetical protein
MRILIDIGHPAHVHLFKNFAWRMQEKGHNILFSVREKEKEVYLLKKYNFPFHSLGKHKNGLINKIIGLTEFNYKLLKIALNFKPDIFISHGSMYAAQVAWLMRKPHISMKDTENMEQIILFKPFTQAILTPICFRKELGKKQIKYKGYHELAYLHPDYFSPNKSILRLLNTKKGEKYVIMRFVSWNASHDIGHKGLSLENKRKAVKEFSKYARVFISSEEELPSDLKKYQFNLPPERMHDALAYADLLYGESATMASEAAVLGIPAIYLDNAGRGYTDEEEKEYGLVFNYSESLKDQEKSIKKAVELLKNKHIKKIWQKKREKMLKDKIDITSLLVWFVENYPESFKIMKANKNYQTKFK